MQRSDSTLFLSEDGQARSPGKILLTPTTIYVPRLLPFIYRGMIKKGLAYITGGGVLDSVPRGLPKHLVVATQWRQPS